MRFFALLEIVIEILDAKDTILRGNLIKWKTDLFGKFKDVSFQLRYKTNFQEDDILTYIQHLNAFCSGFEIRYKDILTMVIPQWLINPYGDIEETDVVIQEELIGISAK
ncbi:uncharacterized protein TNCV_2442161 [Trichonephila clavipes]|nr:uncharacterized protein TNCV_2442161 [Trichonephila clavipes]